MNWICNLPLSNSSSNVCVPTHINTWESRKYYELPRVDVSQGIQQTTTWRLNLVKQEGRKERFITISTNSGSEKPHFPPRSIVFRLQNLVVFDNSSSLPSFQARVTPEDRVSNCVPPLSADTSCSSKVIRQHPSKYLQYISMSQLHQLKPKRKKKKDKGRCY